MRNPEDPRNFFGLQIVHVEEHGHIAQPRREREQRAPNVHRSRRIRRKSAFVRGRLRGTKSPAYSRRFASDDTVHPRIKGIRAAQVRNLAINYDARFLRGVLRERAIADERRRKAKARRPNFGHEPVLRSRVPGNGRCDQIGRSPPRHRPSYSTRYSIKEGGCTQAKMFPRRSAALSKTLPRGVSARA